MVGIRQLWAHSNLCRRAVAGSWRLCALLIGLLGGCSQISDLEIATRGLEANRSLERAGNEQMLINIVRSAYDRPLYFSTVSSVQTSGLFEKSSIGTSVPLRDPGAASKILLGLNLALQEGLLISSAPLDTQEFYQGFLSPLKHDLLVYFLNVGWPRQLVLSLFIRSIKFTDLQLNQLEEGIQARHPECNFTAGDNNPMTRMLGCINMVHKDEYIRSQVKCSRDFAFEPVIKTKTTDASGKPLRIPQNVPVTVQGKPVFHKKFINSTFDYCQYLAFEYLIAVLDKAELTLTKAAAESTSKSTTIDAKKQSIQVTVNTIPPAEGAASALNINVALTCASDDTYLRANTPPRRRLAGPDNAKRAELAVTAAPAQSSPAVTQVIKTPSSVEEPAASGKIASDMCDPVMAPEFGLRSPQAVFHYLGQLVAIENEIHPQRQRFAPRFMYDGKPVAFFTVHSAASIPGWEKTIVSVAFDDKYFFIRDEPPDRADATLPTLTLLQQVLALQKKGSSLPTVPLVRAVGG